MIPFFFILGICMVIHELGHYCFAKRAHVKIYSFNIFLSPVFSIIEYFPRIGRIGFFVTTHTNQQTGNSYYHPLFSIRVGEPCRERDMNQSLSWRYTRFVLGWLPLAAYVSLADSYGLEHKERADSAAASYELRAKSAFQRLLVHAGGALFNLLSGWIFFLVAELIWVERVFTNPTRINLWFEAFNNAIQHFFKSALAFITDPLSLFFYNNNIIDFLPIAVSYSHSLILNLGLISVILAILNLLPVPGLDGSRICLNLYECITRHKPSEYFRFLIDRAGNLILLLWGGYCLYTWIF